MNALLTDGFVGLLEEIVRAAGATAAGIGVPGLGEPDRACELSEMLTRRTGCPVHVTRDADTARAGGLPRRPRVAVIAGTGSAAFGWNGVNSVQVGGHGFLLGDEGSAYWMGRAAVRSALRWTIRWAVRAGPPRRDPGHRFGLEALIRQIHTHPAQRERLTVLAPVVAGLAREDGEARRILLRAAEHFAALAEGARRRLASASTGGRSVRPPARRGRRRRVQRRGDLGPLRRSSPRPPPPRPGFRRCRPASRADAKPRPCLNRARAGPPWTR